jgi:PAS domain S-box-containing protein
MALALKQRRPIRGTEAVAERPDGTRVPFLPYPTPLFDDSGALIGAVNVLVDISEQKRALEMQERLAAIVESSDDAIVSKNIDSTITSWNRGAERLFGYSAEEVVGKSVTILIPPDQADEEPSILNRIRRGERIDHYETIRRRKDGSLVDVSLTISPVRDAQGKIVGASKIARDISDRKRAQEQRDLLLREMNHRVANLFTVAGAVTTLSAQTTTSPEAMAKAIQGRMTALARAHNLISAAASGDGTGEEATVQGLIRTTLAPYAADGRERFACSGPDAPVGGNAITSLALVFYELATNAAKYGALSVSGGRIEIGCFLREREFTLTWKEQGGPPADRPHDHAGFGTTLMRRMVEGQFGGRVSEQWLPEGLTIQLSVLLDRLIA